MPPVVVREPVVDGPVGLAGGQPVDAVAQPALHLHDVRDGVHGPGIAGIQFQRAAARRLGTRVVRGLLEAERVHAEHVAIARHASFQCGNTCAIRSRSSVD